MKAIIIPQKVVLNTSRFFRDYPVAAAEAEVDKIILSVHGEDRLLLEHLKQQTQPQPGAAAATAPAKTTTEKSTEAAADAKPDDPNAMSLRVCNENNIAAWPACPPRLGRISTKFVSDDLHTHEELVVLPAQLAALKQRHPNKRHFRFAMVNGFGVNLGDNTIGVAAFRQVANCMQEYFTSFSVDMLFGPDVSRHNVDILAHEPWIEQILFQGPALIDFADYDAYFDVSGLITLPRFDSMPTINWYLWWFGLDPDAVPLAEKRNRASIRWDAWNSVRQALKKVAGKKIFFNPKASVTLRSMPESVVAPLIRGLLNEEKKLSIVVDRPCGVKHDRVINLADHIDSPEKFKALIAQVDGMISVDSFGPQFADAVSTPCVHLCATLTEEFYPAYPYSTVIELDNIRNLPAFHKFKVEEAEWATIRDEYERAWHKLDAKQILNALNRNIEKRGAALQEPVGLKLIAEKPVPSCVCVDAAGVRLKRQRVDSVLERSQDRLVQLTRAVLKPGSTCILAGAPVCAPVVSMARHVQPGGDFRVFEPRPVLAQMLGGALVHANIFTAQLYQTLPIAEVPRASIPDLNPWSESHASAWGNSLRTLSVPSQPIDSLNLEFCHALAIQPPMPALRVVTGALKTIQRCRPLLFISPISKADAAEVCNAVTPAGYTAWAEACFPELGADILLLLCAPSELDAKINGFVKIEVKKEP